MPSCVIKCCKNNTKVNKKSEGISFHTFPTNILIRDEWVASVRLSRNEPQWQPSSSSVVCSDHFDKSDMYDTKRGLRRVHRTGYPKKKLFPHSNEVVSDVLLPNITSSFVPVLPISPSVVNNSNYPALPRTSSASVLDLPDESKSHVNQDSILDTPRKHKLREKLNKQEIYFKTYVKKIKSLQQRVRRLKNRNLSLKKIIKTLKTQKNA